MKAANEKRNIGKGRQLNIETRRLDDQLAVFLSIKDKKKCVLHWGVCRRMDEPWRRPLQSIWPAESHATGQDAVETPFKLQDDQNLITLTMNYIVIFPLSLLCSFSRRKTTGTITTVEIIL